LHFLRESGEFLSDWVFSTSGPLQDGICDKPFQTLRGVGEVAVFIEVEIASVSEP
jgi:hypothetical protein